MLLSTAATPGQEVPLSWVSLRRLINIFFYFFSRCAKTRGRGSREKDSNVAAFCCCLILTVIQISRLKVADVVYVERVCVVLLFWSLFTRKLFIIRGKFPVFIPIKRTSSLRNKIKSGFQFLFFLLLFFFFTLFLICKRSSSNPIQPPHSLPEPLDTSSRFSALIRR